ncbi:MAG: hypothetical protein KJN90_04000 [Gammaproteobacteria bacterium]|nr:hypothetical protein [Gammaproteobacteria bacterium]
MKNQVVTFLISAFILLATSSAMAQNENPFIGTWDIDMDESDFGSNAAPQNMSRSYTDLGNGSYAYQVATVSQDGTLGLSSAIYSYSGQEYPIVSFDELPAPAMISYNRINDTTVEYTVRLGDEVSQIGSKIISPNYQRLTISIQFPGTDQENQILIFNKRR